MANAPSATAKGKARADDSGAASSSALPPPRTPPRRPQPPAQPSTFATPSSSAFPATPNSKRKFQTCIDSYFPSRKKRIEFKPLELSPAEKKAKKEQEADIKALIKDIEKEEREAKRAEREAEQQLKRETLLAAARERRKKARHRADWNRWCERNAKPNATFEIPKDLLKGDLWILHRSISQCVKDFGLNREEVFCLEHCCRPNYHDEGATDITLFRIDDVQKLAWRKEAMLAGIECNKEQDLIAEGKSLFLQKQMAKTASKSDL